MQKKIKELVNNYDSNYNSKKGDYLIKIGKPKKNRFKKK